MDALTAALNAAVAAAQTAIDEIEKVSTWWYCKSRPTTHLYKAHVAAVEAHTAAVQAVAALPAPPPPPPAPAPDAPGLGLTAHLGLWRFPTARNADALNAATKIGGTGVRLIRDDLWVGSSAEQISRIVAAAKAGKFGLSLVLSGNTAKRDPAATADGARKLLASVAAEAMKVGIANPVRYVEPMNEPNKGGAYGNDPEGYAALCTAITRAVRSLDIGVKVLGGSTNGPGNFTWDGKLDWLDRALTAGCEFDEWCVHGYYYTTGISVDQMFTTSVATDWNKIFWYRNAKSPETVADVLARHGYNGLIHLGECGVATDAYPSGVRIPFGGFGTTSESVQAAWFPRAWAMWRQQARAGWFMPYEAVDWVTADTADREKHFGAWRDDGSEKPIVAEFRKATAVL